MRRQSRRDDSYRKLLLWLGENMSKKKRNVAFGLLTLQVDANLRAGRFHVEYQIGTGCCLVLTGPKLRCLCLVGPENVRSEGYKCLPYLQDSSNYARGCG